MLSVNVSVILVIREGWKICGMKKLDESSVKIMQTELQLLNFRRSILKTPSKNMLFEDSLDNFWRKGLRKIVLKSSILLSGCL